MYTHQYLVQVKSFMKLLVTGIITKMACSHPMEMDNETLVLRPMNCPHHMMVLKMVFTSYRNLPIRIAELGTMHRYEMSGAVIRSTTCTRDDFK